MEISYTEFLQHINRFYLPFLRISSFFMVVPIFGSRLVTKKARLLIALAVTYSVATGISDVPAFDPVSLASVPIIFKQIVIGVGMGFMVQIFIQLAALAGQIMAMQMGLGFAMMMDPSNGVNTVTIGQLYLMLFTLLYLAVDGHLVTMSIMIESFNTFPLTQTSFDVGMFRYITEMASWMFVNALKIALPAIMALYIVNFTFGVMSRAAQQLQVFSIGFPFTLIYGLVIIWIVIGILLPQFESIFESLLQRMQALRP